MFYPERIIYRRDKKFSLFATILMTSTGLNLTGLRRESQLLLLFILPIFSKGLCVIIL